MSWGKVDDGLHSHVKWRSATKGARALWTTALSWSCDQGTGGHIPEGILRSLDGTRAEARCLVAVGLWVDDPDGGWRFHQWDERNPDAASVAAKREAQAKGGEKGNHVRWHVKKRVRVGDCPWCYPDRFPIGSTDT